MRALVIFLLPWMIVANKLLIDEMESLRATLPLKDQARPQMTLRLADLYFEESRSKEKNLLLKGEGSKDNVDKLRKKAVQLYRESLSGHGGIFPVPQGELNAKIHFQLARLYHRSQETSKAMQYYKKVVGSHHHIADDIKRESHLGLAEIYENSGRLKFADGHYTKAREVCHGTGDVCSYIHYKRSWVLYKDMRLEEAIGEIRKSLFDSKGQVKERSLQDYMLFLSNRETDGIEEITLMEKLQEKTSRKNLMRDLMEGYFSVGNRKAALNFLTILNRREPNLYDRVRMAEELYGFKMWERFDTALSEIEEYKKLPNSLDSEKKNLSLKIFERLIVQLDAEREGNSLRADFLLRTIMAFLNIFPQNKNRNKMMQGWLTAQNDDGKKILQLKEWISDDLHLGHEKDALNFRVIRLALAEKNQDNEAFLEESLALSKYYEKSNKNKAREYAYTYAYKNYQLKKYDKALSFFEKLSQTTGGEAPDKWAVQAQNLALDIFSQRKNYRTLIEKADTWLKQKNHWTDASIQRELDELLKIKKQAQFEYAAQLGTDKKALEIFRNFCLNNEFKEKSCINAKVLAVKLKDQQKLVETLKHLKDEKSLLAEYELMGEFHLAAPLYEKLVLRKQKSIEHYLKTALLYELALNEKKSHLQIKELSQYIRKTKKMPKDFESILYRMMKEADLITNPILTTMPWSPNMKIIIARDIEAGGKGDKITHKILVNPKETTGHYWAKFYLKKIELLNQKQEAIGFYGRGSKRKFNRRLKALEKFKKELTNVAQGARVPTRIIVFDMAERAYSKLADIIEATPLPEGLEEEQVASLKDNLKNLSAPFREEAKNYEKLREEFIGKMEEDKALVLVDSLSKTQKNFYTLVQQDKRVEREITQRLPIDEYRSKLSELKDRPADIEILKSVQNLLKENKQERMAAYFTGRLDSLKAKEIRP